MSRFAFALRPKWILGHLIVLALVVMFVSAGFWQLRRLHQRRAFNAEVAANMAAPVAPLDEVLPTGSTFADVPPQLDRRVRVTGRYLVDQEVVITGQASPDSIPGVWLVTPLETDDGRVVLVNRGWVPSTGEITSSPVDARPPTGRVSVVGLVSETQLQTSGESPERNAARQRSFLRIDVARIQRQFSERLVPAFLQRVSQTPPDAGKVVPATLDPPVLTDGPHLSYALQWFGFTVVALVGYPLLLWMMAKDRERVGVAGDGPPDDLPPGAFVDEDGIVDLTDVDAEV